MNNKKKKRGLLAGGLIVLFLLLAAGVGWWLLQTKFPIAPKPPAEPGFIFIISPSSGDEIAAGDYVPVTVQSISAKTLKNKNFLLMVNLQAPLQTQAKKFPGPGMPGLLEFIPCLPA